MSENGQEMMPMDLEGVTLMLRRQAKLTAEIERLEDKLAQAKADTQLLDYLQVKLGRYSGRVICRWSTIGHGWRLHETGQGGAVSDVRMAIRMFMLKEKGKRRV